MLDLFSDLPYSATVWKTVALVFIAIDLPLLRLLFSLLNQRKTIDIKVLGLIKWLNANLDQFKTVVDAAVILINNYETFLEASTTIIKNDHDFKNIVKFNEWITEHKKACSASFITIEKLNHVNWDSVITSIDRIDQFARDIPEIKHDITRIKEEILQLKRD